MKIIVTGIAAALTAAVLFCGCGKKEETPPPVPPGTELKTPLPPPLPTDTQPIPPAAPSAPNLVASAKTAVDQAMALAKEGKYQEALVLLQQKLPEVQPSAEGKNLIEQAIAQIKQMMADAAMKAAAEKVGGSVGKALGGLPK